MREQVRKLALELGVVGLMNVSAVKDNEIHLIEVNPVPPRPCPCPTPLLAKIAARTWLGL